MFYTFFSIFVAVFLAELGDKTQLATMVFAADGQKSPLIVFLASSSALVLASALGVFFGKMLAGTVNIKLLHTLSGVFFIAIGVLILSGKF